MTPEEKEAALRNAAARAVVLLDLQATVIQYGAEHEITGSELATFIAGLLVCTVHPEEIGGALGSIIGKVLDYLPIHSGAVMRLARAQPQGTA